MCSVVLKQLLSCVVFVGSLAVLASALVPCYFDDEYAVKEYLVDAKTNVSLGCPGISEQSLVQDLEWKSCSTQTKFIEYSGATTTISEHKHRVSLDPKSFALRFHPVEASDSGDYVCLFNSSPQPDAIVRVYVQDVPDPPGQPLILGYTSRFLNLSWAPPPDNHYGDVTYYIIHTRIGENGKWNTEDPLVTKDNTTRLEIYHLQPFTVYSFRVIAVNAKGPSDVSKESFYIFTLREIPSGRPLITNAHNTSTTSIHISWRPPDQTTIHGEFLGYRITYKPRDRNDGMKEIFIRDPSVEAHTITGLETYTQYLVSIQVFNPEGLGPASTVRVMTDEGVPTKPVNLSVLDTRHDSIVLQWSEPENLNGVISGYRLYYAHGNFTDVQNFKITGQQPIVNYTLTGLIPNTEYKLNVNAFSGSHEGELSDAIIFKTDIGGPPAPVVVNATCYLNNSLYFQWQRPKDFPGKIVYYDIHFKPDHSYEYAEIRELDCGYDECYILIEKLLADTVYLVRVRGMSVSRLNGLRVFEGQFSKVHRILVREHCEEVSSDMMTAHDIFPHSIKAGLICAVIAATLAVLGIIVWRKCYHSAYYYLDDPVRVPVTTKADWESTQRCSITVKGKEVTNCGGAIPVDQFAEHVAKLHVDGDIGFSKEYEAIQNDIALEDYKSEYSQLPENLAKNRYLNIIAYDHSRVQLLPMGGNKKAVDYLNANYIDGFQCAKAYIGTQGPLPSTFDSFWRMVWEQHVAIIVMITNLVERGRRKCDMYWPKDGSETYGVIHVKVLKEDVMATYTVRTFKISHTKIKKKKDEKTEKLVYQYHYTNWPDHGTPEHPLPILHFVKKSSAANPRKAGPIIVHCSAGVGRTGTYIVLDSMLKQIRVKKEVNVWGFLRHIRSQRNFLVQTEEQYVFIHDALVEAISTGCESNITLEQLPKFIDMLQAPDENGLPKLLIKHFELITSCQSPELITSALKPVNVAKNRRTDVIPLESFRVHLTPQPGEEGSDFINATWLQGFYSLREFIVTQHPMAHTIMNFWQMIWDHNVQTIVLLSYCDNQDFPVFWPFEHKCIDAENFRIKCTSERLSDDNDPIFDFSLQSLQDDYELHVHMIQSFGWPHTCASLSSAINLPSYVQRTLAEFQNGPIVVVDKFGGVEAATFCCLTTLAKSLAFDGHADAYMYSKLYHYKRPNIWSSYDDYLRLYLILKTLSPNALPIRHQSCVRNSTTLNGCVTNGLAHDDYTDEYQAKQKQKRNDTKTDVQHVDLTSDNQMGAGVTPITPTVVAPDVMQWSSAPGAQQMQHMQQMTQIQQAQMQQAQKQQGQQMQQVQIEQQQAQNKPMRMNGQNQQQPTTVYQGQSMSQSTTMSPVTSMTGIYDMNDVTNASQMLLDGSQVTDACMQPFIVTSASEQMN